MYNAQECRPGHQRGSLAAGRPRTCGLGWTRGEQAVSWPAGSRCRERRAASGRKEQQRQQLLKGQGCWVTPEIWPASATDDLCCAALGGTGDGGGIWGLLLRASRMGRAGSCWRQHRAPTRSGPTPRGEEQPKKAQGSAWRPASCVLVSPRTHGSGAARECGAGPRAGQPGPPAPRARPQRAHGK